MAPDIVGHPYESNQMSLAFEREAFERGPIAPQQLSCTLVTGFLGSGKTTLVQHIQRQRGNLRVAVLVNDFAEVDIDSFLLDQSQTNAALGIPTVRLASGKNGGCFGLESEKVSVARQDFSSAGCACCTIRGKFSDAIKAIKASSHNFDHLIVETSGISDPRPIATLLESEGISLHLIVTLVDAEWLPKILPHPVARRQLSMADLVLVNKCDLVSLAQISDVEDTLETELGSHTRVVRTHFCRVPVDLILDTAPRQVAPPLTATSSNSSEGVLSHEASAASVPCTPVVMRGGRKWETMDASAASPGIQAGDVDNETAHSPTSFASTVFESDTPLSLARFQCLVLGEGALREAAGLLRVKGHLWVKERRRDRFIFQLSGRQRCENLCVGQWESTPATCLVLIGRDRAELDCLRAHLATCVEGEEEGACRDGGGADEFRVAVSEDKRFQLFQPETSSRDETEEHFAVEFGLIGNALRGVAESSLNTALMVQVNGRGRCFLSMGQRRGSGSGLVIAIRGDSNVSAMWEEISGVAAGVVRTAFKNVCSCRCDISPHMRDSHAH